MSKRGRAGSSANIPPPTGNRPGRRHRQSREDGDQLASATRRSVRRCIRSRHFSADQTSWSALSLRIGTPRETQSSTPEKRRPNTAREAIAARNQMMAIRQRAGGPRTVTRVCRSASARKAVPIGAAAMRPASATIQNANATLVRLRRPQPDRSRSVVPAEEPELPEPLACFRPRLVRQPSGVADIRSNSARTKDRIGTGWCSIKDFQITGAAPDPFMIRLAQM